MKLCHTVTVNLASCSGDALHLVELYDSETQFL